MKTKRQNEQYLVSEIARITVENEYSEILADAEIINGLGEVFRHVCALADSDMDGLKLRVMDVSREKYIITAGGKQYILRRLH